MELMIKGIMAKIQWMCNIVGLEKSNIFLPLYISPVTTRSTDSELTAGSKIDVGDRENKMEATSSEDIERDRARYNPHDQAFASLKQPASTNKTDSFT